MSDVSDAQFHQAVMFFRHCLLRGYIRLRFAGGVDTPELEPVDKPAIELAQEEFVISREIYNMTRRVLPGMIRAILSGSKRSYIAQNIMPISLKEASDRNKGTSEEDITRQKQAEAKSKEIEERLQIVDNNLIDQRMRERFVLKANSSSATFHECSGEVSKQLYSTVTSEKAGFYVTLTINIETLSKGESTNPFAIIFGRQQEQSAQHDSISLHCDEADLDVLIDIATNLRDRLKEQILSEVKEHDAN